MADTKNEDETVENGDDDQWLYGDSNSNLDPAGTSVENVKPSSELVGVPEDEVLYFNYFSYLHISNIFVKKTIIFSELILSAGSSSYGIFGQSGTR